MMVYFIDYIISSTRLWVEFNDDNAADSYGLARMAGKLHIDDIETKIIEQIKDPKYRDSL